MLATDRARLVAEVRQRRADFPNATGWTPLHFDAALEEIDDQYRQLLDARAKVSELAVKLQDAR